MARHYKNNGHYKDNNGGRHFKRGAKSEPRIIRSVKKLGSGAKTAVISVAGAVGSKLSGAVSRVFRKKDRYKSKYGKRKKKVIKFSGYSRYNNKYSSKEKSKPARLKHEAPEKDKPNREPLRFEAPESGKPKREVLRFESLEPERPLTEKPGYEAYDEKPKRETIKFELPEEEVLRDLTIRFNLPEDERPITETLKFELPQEEKTQKQVLKPEHSGDEKPQKRSPRFSSLKAAGIKRERPGKKSGKSKIPGTKRKRKEKFTAENLPTTEQLEAELKWERNKKSNNGLIRNTVFALITVAAAAVLTATLFLPILQIYGTSMTPTLSEGEIVVSVKGSGFEQGDVISFYYNNKILVKRVIAFEGDFVNIDEDGTVLVNNREIDEPYLTEKDLGECDIKLPYQVPAGKIFVLGDHRKTSVDSRSSVMGCVSEEQIVGKIVFRVWPLDRMGGIQ